MYDSRYSNILIIIVAICLSLVAGYTCIYVANTTVATADNTVSIITISDTPDLVNSLKMVNKSGVIIAMHGWHHENYSEISTEELISNTEKAKKVFSQVGLPNYIEVMPYAESGVKVNTNTVNSMKSINVSILHDGAQQYEYTWNWYNIANDNDSRILKAQQQINKDKPTLILCHAQDWNIYTYTLLDKYLSSTHDKNIIIRMDDVDINTKPLVIEQFTTLSKYASVGSVVIAIIPEDSYRQSNVNIDGIPITTFTDIYFKFYIITALLPLLFFIIWRELTFIKKTKNNKKDIKYPDLVSIIIPAFNEEKSIAKCIESFLTQNYPGAKEIIIISDGSTDKTMDYASQYPVKVISKLNGGKSSALNIGVKEASGDIIMFTDGDTLMDSEALDNIVKCFDFLPHVDIVTGNVYVNRGKNKLLTGFQQIEYHIEQELTRHLQSQTEGVIVCPGPITAVRRKVTDKIKFSDQTIVEDADFTVTALQAGLKIVRCASAKCYTNSPQTLKSWIKQRKRWWYGNLQLWRLHRKWGITNPWMVYNYLGYIISVFSVFMLLSMPILLMQYDQVSVVFLRGIVCIVTALLLYMITIGCLFTKHKRLFILLIPYMLTYCIMKMFMLAYLYICYITGIGMDVQFGPNKMHVK